MYADSQKSYKTADRKKSAELIYFIPWLGILEIGLSARDRGLLA